MPNRLPLERVALAGVIDPDANGAAAYSTEWVDFGKYESVLALITVGEINSSGTVNAKLEQATDSSGSGVKDVTGSSITQLTQAGSDSDKQVAIQMREEEMDAANDFSHVRLTVTVATSACDMGAVLLGMFAREDPAYLNDLSSVAEIVTV